MRAFLFATALAIASLPGLATAQDIPPPPLAPSDPSAMTRLPEGAPGLRVALIEDSPPVTLWYAPRARMAAALASVDLAPFAAACIAPCTLALAPDDYVLAIAPSEGTMATYPQARRTLHLDADDVLRVGFLSHQGNRDSGTVLLLSGLGAFVLGTAIGVGLIAADEAEAGVITTAIGALSGVVLALVGLFFAIDLDEGVIWLE